MKASSEGGAVASTASPPTPQWPNGAGWVVSDMPDLVLGAGEGESAFPFGNPTAAFQLDDGRVAVADNMAKQIAFFDADGGLLHVAGRDGEGPGEFRMLAAAFRSSLDSIVVYDYQLLRISVLDSRGAFVRSLRPVSAEPLWTAGLGLIDDEHLLINVRTPEKAQDIGLVHHTIELGIVSLLTGAIQSLGTYPGKEAIRMTRGGHTYSMRAPFARSTLGAAGAGFYYVGSSYTDSLWAYDAAGKATAVTPGVRPIQAVPQDGALRFFGSEAFNSMGRRFGYAGEAPDTMPTFDTLLVDVEGNLWVQRFAPPWRSEDDALWDVYDSDGTWLGTVGVPGGSARGVQASEVLSIGRDHLLVLEQDSVGIRRVARYALTKYFG
jgi:hypothetical protein